MLQFLNFVDFDFEVQFIVLLLMKCEDSFDVDVVVVDIIVDVCICGDVVVIELIYKFDKVQLMLEMMWFFEIEIDYFCVLVFEEECVVLEFVVECIWVYYEKQLLQDVWW